MEKSPLEIEAKCPHFGGCGGYTYQSIPYEEELKIKENQVKRLFVEEGIEDFNFLGVERSPSLEEYRNKMEYTFGDEHRDGPLSLGLHKKGRFYEVVSVGKCNIVDRDFAIILGEVINYFRNTDIPCYNKKIHVGVLRHFVIRKALSTGEILLNLVTSSQGEVPLDELIERLKKLELDGEIKGFIHTINDNVADAIKVDRSDLVYGRDYIIEEILGLKFKISPFSFFQTNTFGAEKLYSIVRDFAGDIDDKIVEEAVEKAYENSKLNRLDNVEFIAGDVLEEVEKLVEKPDLIILDPPREGINPKALQKIIDFSPEKFVYVSCNPVTLVRDLKEFIDRGYRIEKVKCMDMFPRTGHVEVVTRIVSETTEESDVRLMLVLPKNTSKARCDWQQATAESIIMVISCGKKEKR
ncbi:23S rRNA (uracil-5-)-methyltransferase RumA [Tissierella carlieri]|nr:23S rRNA (uracil-5-)-methyltransferase RumA [Tissierella carlieri]